MDKIVYIFIRFLLIAFILIGCGNNNTTAKNDKLSIIFGQKTTNIFKDIPNEFIKK